MKSTRVILHDTILTPALPAIRPSSLTDLDRRIAKYLERHGFRLQDTKPALALIEGQKLTFPEYAKKLGEQNLCDLVIMPRVVMRQAQLQNSDARWDGVIRPIPTNGAAMVWTGYQKAASLMIDVHTCGNAPVLEGMGGLDIAFGIQVTEYREHQGYASTTAQERAAADTIERNYLGNNTYVDEAIAIAFHPLIPMPDYPKNPEPYLGPRKN
jgi:hypothetical protein